MNGNNIVTKPAEFIRNSITGAFVHHEIQAATSISATG